MNKMKNKNFLKLFLLSCLLVFSFSLASNVHAALVPCGLNGAADCTLCHLVLGFKNIYDYLLGLLLAATTLVIVVAGVMYMVSSGAKGMIEKAKSALTYALTAIILGLLAWLIINTVLNALGYNKSASWWNFTCDTAQTVGPTSMGSGGATLPGNNAGGGAATGTGSGGSPMGTGMVTSGQKTLDQVGQGLKDVTVYTDCNKNPCGWRDGKLYTDCSGFAQEFYKQAYGIDPGRSTVDMRNNANGSTDIGSIKTGSLVIMTGGGANSMHAGIFMDTDQNLVINNTGVGKNVVYYPVKQDRILGVIKAPV